MDRVAIGMDIRIDEFGDVHPWRVVVAYDARYRQFLMRLPRDRRWVSPPTDGHGDLTELPRSAEEQTHALAEFLTGKGVATVVAATWHHQGSVMLGLRERGFGVEEVELPIPAADISDIHNIGGEAGHEIAHLLDPALREAGFMVQAITRGEVTVN